MAVYTKIGLDEINLIEKNFSIGKILNYSGIKKGIENTNYLIKSKKRKFYDYKKKSNFFFGRFSQKRS